MRLHSPVSPVCSKLESSLSVSHAARDLGSTAAAVSGPASPSRRSATRAPLHAEACHQKVAVLQPQRFQNLHHSPTCPRHTLFTARQPVTEWLLIHSRSASKTSAILLTASDTRSSECGSLTRSEEAFPFSQPQRFQDPRDPPDRQRDSLSKARQPVAQLQPRRLRIDDRVG